MAQIHGIAGEWTRVKGSVAGLWPVFLGVAAAGFSVATAFFASAPYGSAAFAVSVAATGFALARALKRMESYFKGARGEERVSGILRSLPDGYHVFNDFVALGTHVDHVVVGPAGVFSVETKNWRAASSRAGRLSRRPSRRPRSSRRSLKGSAGRATSRPSSSSRPTPSNRKWPK